MPAVVQYLPTFFFGALLTVFGIEIAGDWLVRSYSKVSLAEYLLLLATFVSILQLELEMGVAAGILLCCVYFAVTYARVSASATAWEVWGHKQWGGRGSGWCGRVD